MVINDPMVYKMRDAWGKLYADIIREYFTKNVSLLEAGAGEGNTLEAVARHIGAAGSYYGFDISWSRIATAKANLEKCDVKADLFTGNR